MGVAVGNTAVGAAVAEGVAAAALGIGVVATSGAGSEMVAVGVDVGAIVGDGA